MILGIFFFLEISEKKSFEFSFCPPGYAISLIFFFFMFPNFLNCLFFQACDFKHLLIARIRLVTGSHILDTMEQMQWIRRCIMRHIIPRNVSCDNADRMKNLLRKKNLVSLESGNILLNQKNMIHVWFGCKMDCVC